MVRYAYAKEDKAARRDAILAAALILFLNDTRRLPAVAAIAIQAQLAKGTVYLYFETKEEIFAALLSREWETFLAMVEQSVTGKPGPGEGVADPLIDGFVSFLTSHPYFMRLDSLGYGHLEAGLPLEQFWTFKSSFGTKLRGAGLSIDHAFSLEAGQGLMMLLDSYALAKGLFQTLDIPDEIRIDERFGSHPLAGMDFTAALRAALTRYWQGALLPVTVGRRPGAIP